MSYNISTLIFVRDPEERLLLIKRNKSPNKGKWSPIGGKLKMDLGESPFECAIRETREESGLDINEAQLHLFGYVAEKNYEGVGHWLMFLFACKKEIHVLPKLNREGKFGLFKREDLKLLPVPLSDKDLIWPLYDKYRDFGFSAVRADFNEKKNLNVKIEETIV